ncbi:hypothetical protein ACIRF8_11610 [Streptomyces sp. NPDC102406]|uniref:hypothetical protein n=1 Tax=Streptomyces sp. NPDC102406 TaxID=3366171 RepID=UPI0037F6CDD7
MTDPAPVGPDVPPDPDGDRGEVERLRAEVAALRADAAARTRRRGHGYTVRRTIAAVLIALVGFCAVASVIGVWGARTTLNTDRWVATVGPLPQDHDVNAAVTKYLTDEIYGKLDVETRLSEALPPKASFLAAPVNGAVRDFVRDKVSELLGTDTFRSLWEGVNRTAHSRIVAVLEDRAEGVSVNGTTVTLNLLPLMNDVLNAVEQQLPTLFGKELDLPAIGSGEIPPGLHDKIEKALGVSLPADFGQITLYDRDKLGPLQDAVLLFKRGVAGLVIGTLLLLGVAVWVSPDRRRTVLQLGLWLVVSVTVLSGVLRAVRDQILAALPDGVYHDGVRAALYTLFTTLRERGDQLLWLGIVLAVVAYLVGPGRLPKALRRYAVQGARAANEFAARTPRQAGGFAGLRAWVHRHVDVLRVAGVVVAAVVALLFSSWTALLVMAVLLAGYVLLVTVLARPAGPDEAAAPEPPADPPSRPAAAHE